jgi:uncharacterized protein involved in exopolysaccharide biosynthesis
MQNPPQISHTNLAQAQNRALGLNDVVSTLNRFRRLILVITLVSTLGGCLAAWLLPKKYEAYILLAPVSREGDSGSAGGLSASLSQLGGLASLAGFALPGGGAKAETVATLQSEALTERYINENNLLPILFRSRWDPKKKAWNTTDPDVMPSLWKGNRLFTKKIRLVAENAKTGLVGLSITWTDPVLAARWANGIVKLTNKYLQDQAISEAERNITYLNTTAANTSVVELRTAIYSLIESQIRKEMLARGSEEFALRVVDPAAIPEKPTSPGFIVWALVGIGAGLVVSTVIAFALDSMGPRSP